LRPNNFGSGRIRIQNTDGSNPKPWPLHGRPGNPESQGEDPLTVGLILVVPAHVVLVGEGEEALLEGHVQRADGPLLVLLRPFQIVNGAPEQKQYPVDY